MTLFFVEATVVKVVNFNLWCEERIYKSIIVADEYDDAVSKFFHYWKKKSEGDTKFIVQTFNITEAIT